ncbi:MBL fold metallo-hydrolase [Amaricoccus solimangrovi]|uniref:MBL fold metallo-hydrolase n=1 Tax=Amaricoccus solimangrovi TaxID=2589815 RepID=A0A501WP70_9RHOB|nr:MBL fold metallo-hydrolase [Amaricoccus solimangrovi]TPE48821.1 MBL fold metallo-hydrolase [Amaricoccus solimangrovi]
MSYSRRKALGFAALAGATLAGLRAAWAMEGDSYDTEAGEIMIHPVRHASFVMTTPGLVVYSDPVWGAELYDGLPRPGLILITHEHKDHFDPETLSALVGEDTRLVTNPSVHDKLPEALRMKATPLANGESATAGDIGIEAVPAYNTTPDRLQYHPKGRDNGYVLTIGGQRIYIAGDTEDIPELRAQEDIDIAFVPMNLPYTMDVEQAASGVAAFAPKVVYPYHYGESDLDAFEKALEASGAPTKVVRGAWYPTS